MSEQTVSPTPLPRRRDTDYDKLPDSRPTPTTYDEAAIEQAFTEAGFPDTGPVVPRHSDDPIEALIAGRNPLKAVRPTPAAGGYIGSAPVGKHRSTNLDPIQELGQTLQARRADSEKPRAEIKSKADETGAKTKIDLAFTPMPDSSLVSKIARARHAAKHDLTAVYQNETIPSSSEAAPAKRADLWTRLGSVGAKLSGIIRRSTTK